MAFLDYPGLQRFTNRFKTWVNGIIGNSDMGTTATTVTGAIAEHTEQIESLQSVNPVLAVNEVGPDSSGNVNISTVDYAYNLVAGDAQSSSGHFIERTAGGSASISDGEAWVSTIRGNSVHNGYVPKTLDWEYAPGERQSGSDLSVQFDESTFVSYVLSNATITLSYESIWSADPALYGFTISGTPVSGDTITINYVKEVRGTIINATPSSFNSTGWNLFRYTTEYEGYSGYARVLKYSNQYGFWVGGSYTAIMFSPTFDGAKEPLSDVAGFFDVQSDGYVWVVGGDNTSTYVCMAWSDWTNGPDRQWEEYSTSTIDLSSIMEHFPFGLCRVGTVSDVIDFDIRTVTSNIGRISYSTTNLDDVKSTYSAWEYDEQWIYYVKNLPNVYDYSSLNGSYLASDHGLEFFDDTNVSLYATMLYGQNLRDKLRTDVLTISAQELTDVQKAQVQANIGIEIPSFNIPYMSQTLTGNGLSCYLRRWGRVVTFTIPGKAPTNSIKSGATIFTFPEAFKPMSGFTLIGNNGGWSSYSTFSVASTTGALTCKAAISGAIAVHGSYLANDLEGE